jgi:hypothetical protein
MRAAARHSEWEAVNKERQTERNLRTATRTGAKEKSFFERRKVWREERQKEEELRAAAQDEVRRIRDQERSDENKLGQQGPFDEPGVKK